MSESPYPIIVISQKMTPRSQIYWDKDFISVGRGKHNDICIPSPGKKISREHIRLEKEGGAFFLCDLNSRNGTGLNNQKLDPKARVEIQPGDKIKIGDCEISFYESISTTPVISHDDDEGMTAEMTDILSATALARKEKLAVLSMSSAWDREDSKSRWGGYIVFIVLFGLGVGAATQFGFFTNNKESTVDENTNNTSSKTTVETFQVPKPHGEELVLNAVGNVQARRQVLLRPEINGKIEFITADEGQEVKKGQILAKLDQSETNIKIDVARTKLSSAKFRYLEIKSRYKQAQNDFVRSKKLHKKGYISDNKLEESRTEYDTLSHRVKRYENEMQAQEHELKRLELELSRALIVAPFNGVITKKMAEVGFVVSPQEDGVFVLVDRSKMGVEVDINETYANRIVEGQKVGLTLIAYANKEYQGKVRKIFPSADRRKATIKVDVAFLKADQRVLPEMGVKVSFLKKNNKSKQKIYIPTKALQENETEKWVWVVNQGKTQKQLVSVGGILDDSVEIKSGLKAGDQVITFPLQDIRENIEVTVSRKN